MPEVNPFHIQKFGGLNYRDDPKDVGWSAAVSGQDFTLEDPGIVRTRDGSTLFADLNCDNYLGPYSYTTAGGVDYLLAFCSTSSTKTTTLKYVATDGTVSSAGGAWTGAADIPIVTGITKVGTATASTVLFASRDATTRIRLKYWAGSGNVTNTTTNHTPKYLGTTPNSNRLVAANYAAAADTPSGADGSESTVFFSNADGAYDTFGANNFVLLTPGDGEVITGVTSYRDFTFVFKESKFFVFYGESIGPDGSTPEFNYRTVTIPVGTIVPNGYLSASRVATGADGVYFIAGARVYRTDGGAPVEVGDQIREGFTLGGDLPGDYVDVTCADDRVQVSPSYVGETMYVLDIPSGEWTAWGRVGAAISHAGALYARPLSGGAASDHLLKVSSLIRTDRIAGVDEPIIADYVMGEQALSPPGTQGVIREVLFEGYGSFESALYGDGVSPGVQAVTCTSPTLGRYRKAVRGRHFQLYVNSSDATDDAGWWLSSITANVLPSRPGGLS